MTQLTPEQAISVLVQGVKLAQKAGAYSLEDAALLAQAIATLAPKQAEAPAEAEEPVAEDTSAE